MTTLYKYRIYCITDSKYEYVWSEEPPLTCPTNTSDTIDLNSITIIEKIDSNEVKVKEESTTTGGNFATTTLKMTAIKNTTTSVSKSFPFPISALSAEFVTISENIGDTINLVVGKDTTTGTITANVSPASNWVSQNYTESQTINYNNKVYTCILDTINNEVPTNTTYWKHGLRISVSQTVIDNVYKGFYIKLDDLTNNDNVERVIDIDKTNNYIYVENNLVNSYSFATPTYIKQSIYFMKDYDIGHPSKHNIGETKIGGSYVPTNIEVTIEYINKSTTNDKLFVGKVEYLY